MWKVSGGIVSSSSESAEEGGTGGAWKLYVVKSDLSRKADAARACQYGRVMARGRRTLHDARLIDRELEPLIAQQYMCLGCECNAT